MLLKLGAHNFYLVWVKLWHCDVVLLVSIVLFHLPVSVDLQFTPGSLSTVVVEDIYTIVYP